MESREGQLCSKDNEGQSSMEKEMSAEDKTFERLEHVLQVYYERLNSIDERVRELTTFYFGINTLIIGLVVEFVTDNLPRLLLALVGYCVSVTVYLIAYKSFLSWRLYARDLKPLEQELDYDISQNYDQHLSGTPGEIVRVTLVRLRFNFLFIIIWLGTLSYLAYQLSFQLYVNSAWLNPPLYVLGFALIAYVPWAYFTGTLRPKLIHDTITALWAREV